MSALDHLLAADRGVGSRPQAHLFSGDYRMAVGESVERTVANLLAHACSYEHWILAYSGGKDSSTVVTLIVTLLELGAVPRPSTLTVMYADTRMELPPLQAAARVMMDRLSALGITVMEVGDRSAWTVGRIVDAYREARKEDGIASHARQADAWKAMRTFWNDVSPKLIDEDMCRAYVERRKVGPATHRYELSMLAVALRWAKAKKLIEEAPVIWRPAPPPRRERHLTREQFRKFLAGVKAPHARLYMVLAIATCARPTALLELTWDRVDFERGLITLNAEGRAQTRKKRPTVPIADYARGPLLEAYEGRQSDHVIERGGEAIANIKKAFVAASKRSGVHATPYTLRHTGCVWRAEDGISMPELAQLLGHDDSRTTEKHYARFSPTFLRTAANAGSW